MSDDEQADLDEGEISLDDEPGTDDEIEAAKGANVKSKKTAKRKRRATSPNSFGTALQDLLGIAAPSEQDESRQDTTDVEPTKKRKASAKTDVTTPAILSLAPHLRRSAQSTSLSARAARIALDQKRRREERCHVKDVIGGWGAPGVLPPLEDEDGNIVESLPINKTDAARLQDWMGQGGNQGYERKLRKVAQRGVVKLFNAIRAAQTTTEDDLEQAEAAKSVKGGANTAASNKKVPGLVGKEARLADLSKTKFLDLIKTNSSSKSSRSLVAK